MAGTAILMAILGCGDAGTQCEQVGVAPIRYESVSACLSARDEVLAATDVMYPVVAARCLPASGAIPASVSPAAKSLLEKAKPAATDRKRAPRMASLRG